MSLNCNEINEVLNELDLTGSFIQEIVQPGFNTIAFYTYKNANAKTVLVCTAPGACRINETRIKITKNNKPLRFMEFLRSRIKGARVIKCEQCGLNRVIRFDLVHDGELFILYARLWSSAANIILCDNNNIILDSMYRRPAKNEMKGEAFLLPEENADATKKEWPIRPFDELQQEFEQKHPDSKPLTFNEKVDIWYREHAQSLSRESLLAQAEKWYTTTKSRRVCALERLKAKQKSFENSESYKHQGDLILSYAHLIQKENSFLECEDYETGKIIRIKIDTKKTPQENAAEYYSNFHKAQTGSESLKHDIEIAEQQIANLDKAYNDILAEKNPVRIEQMLRHDSTPKQQIKKSHPGLDYEINGWLIIVGRDADENDELLRHHVRGSDMWLHVRDFSGGYVFIKNRPGKTVPLEILLDAGNLAVYYSKARKAGKADLYYTHVKYLRRAKNGPKGLVLPTHEKNLCIQLDEKRLARLDSILQESKPL